jgi:hypothetical protein
MPAASWNTSYYTWTWKESAYCEKRKLSVSGHCTYAGFTSLLSVGFFTTATALFYIFSFLGRRIALTSQLSGNPSQVHNVALRNVTFYVAGLDTVKPWIASNLVCECFARRAKNFNKF